MTRALWRRLRRLIERHATWDTGLAPSRHSPLAALPPRVAATRLGSCFFRTRGLHPACACVAPTGLWEGQRPRCPHREGQRPRCPRREGQRPRCPRREGQRPRCPRREGQRPRCPHREGQRPRCPRREGQRPRCPHREGQRPRCLTSEMVKRLNRRCAA